MGPTNSDLGYKTLWKGYKRVNVLVVGSLKPTQRKYDLEVYSIRSKRKLVLMDTHEYFWAMLKSRRDVTPSPPHPLGASWAWRIMVSFFCSLLC